MVPALSTPRNSSHYSASSAVQYDQSQSSTSPYTPRMLVSNAPNITTPINSADRRNLSRDTENSLIRRRSFSSEQNVEYYSRNRDEYDHIYQSIPIITNPLQYDDRVNRTSPVVNDLPMLDRSSYHGNYNNAVRIPPSYDRSMYYSNKYPRNILSPMNHPSEIHHRQNPRLQSSNSVPRKAVSDSSEQPYSLNYSQVPELIPVSINESDVNVGSISGSNRISYAKNSFIQRRDFYMRNGRRVVNQAPSLTNSPYRPNIPRPESSTFGEYSTNSAVVEAAATNHRGGIQGFNQFSRLLRTDVSHYRRPNSTGASLKFNNSSAPMNLSFRLQQNHRLGRGRVAGRESNRKVSLLVSQIDCESNKTIVTENIDIIEADSTKVTEEEKISPSIQSSDRETHAEECIYQEIISDPHKVIGNNVLSPNSQNSFLRFII